MRLGRSRESSRACYGSLHEALEDVLLERDLGKPVKRCRWAEDNDLAIEYHDREWGVVSRDDRHLFEMLILEGAQAGLSWNTILAKRAEYQRVYAGFDVSKVARFDRRKRERLMKNPGIVRNRLKIESSVTNARAFRAVQAEFGSFADFIWEFVDGRPIQNRWRSLRTVPAQTADSKAMSSALKGRDFQKEQKQTE